MKPRPPCPECGGTQAFFNASSNINACIQISVGSSGFFRGIKTKSAYVLNMWAYKTPPSSK